jgi:hypothetical protein
MTIILPKNAETRWQECLRCESLLCWRAMHHWMLGETHCAVADGNMVMASDLLLLADVAKRHQLDLQPMAQEEEGRLPQPEMVPVECAQGAFEDLGMNNVIEFSSPAPSCLIPITHPARAVLHEPDVATTWAHYSTADLQDDYELVQSQDWLSAQGGFK